MIERDGDGVVVTWSTVSSEMIIPARTQPPTHDP